MKFKIAISTLESLGLVLASQLPAQAVFKDRTSCAAYVISVLGIPDASCSQ